MKAVDGGMGPRTVSALERALTRLPGVTGNRNALAGILLTLAVLFAIGIAEITLLLLNPRTSLGALAPARVVKSSSQPQFSFAIYGPRDQPLRKPLSAVEGPNGDIYVTNAGYGIVQVFDYNGRYKATIGRRSMGDAPGPGEFRYPIGLALDGNGRLYVSDSQSGHISIFEGDRFVGYLAERDGRKEFKVPAGLFYHNGHIYVNDLGYHQVLVVTLGGDVVREIGLGKGGEVGELNFANFSWVDDGGDVYVADSNNSRVQVFAPDGTVKRVYDGGTFGNMLALPRGIAIDGAGRIHVVSTFGHRVEVFNVEGNAAFVYGQLGENDGEFNFPNGLFVAGKRIYVADRENNRVQVWEYGS